MRSPLKKDILKEGDRLILSKYGPASAIINSEMEILQFRGRTGRFLEPPPGQPSNNIIKMAKEGFAMELRNAILKAKKELVPVQREGLRLQTPDDGERFNLEVIPFKAVRSPEQFFLVLFENKFIESREKEKRARKNESAKEINTEINRLQAELTATKEYLQSIIEEQEATNEELRAANEEILSSNEELQSTNEEMETAKEELQSTNEELTTVNEELHTRNVELNAVNNDLSNLLSSVYIPTIMVGNDLRIRRFTPEAEKMLNLIASDLGRPITDINLNLKLPNLEELVLDVIGSIRFKEVEVQDRQGRWYNLQITPYKTLDNKIDGAMLVFIDINVLKLSISETQRYKDYCEAIVDTAHEGFLVLDGSLKVKLANRSFYNIFRVSRDEVVGKFVYDLGNGQWNIPKLRRALDEILPSKSRIENYVVDYRFPMIGKKTMLLNASRLQLAQPHEDAILLAIRDVTIGRPKAKDQHRRKK